MLWALYLAYLRWMAYEYEMDLYDEGHTLIEDHHREALDFWEQFN